MVVTGSVFITLSVLACVVAGGAFAAQQNAAKAPQYSSNTPPPPLPVQQPFAGVVPQPGAVVYNQQHAAGVVVGVTHQPPAQPSHFSFILPPDAVSGAVLQIQAPDGRSMQVQVPPGAVPGSMMTVQNPAPVPEAVVVEAPESDAGVVQGIVVG